MRNPIQPILQDAQGTLRFKANILVCALLDQSGGLDLNALAEKFHREEYADDWCQLAQLIGYSLAGYSELGYVDDASYDAAVAMHEGGLTEDKARIATLEAQLADIRAGLREPVARLFGIHPDDLATPPTTP